VLTATKKERFVSSVGSGAIAANSARSGAACDAKLFSSHNPVVSQPHVLDCVREAEKRIMDKKLNLEYAGIAGVPEFVDAAVRLSYGATSAVVADGKVAAVQSISGTGALRIACQFFAKFWGVGTAIYMPDKTWGNHVPIAEHAGLTVERYAYYDSKSCGLNFAGMIDDLKAMPKSSIVLLHACAHNPTGVDPTAEQWEEIHAVILDRGHTVLFDSAYQGFASGDPEKDASALRMFADRGGIPMLLSQSFAKNFGLYGERVGTLSVVCDTADEAGAVLSQLKGIIRPMYSSPPLRGARIVSEVLTDSKLLSQWYVECKAMADRILSARATLRKEVEALGGDRSWNHITDQIGMFCFTGLTPEQCDSMIEDHHIYMTRDGRISMAGVTQANAKQLASALHAVTSTA
jgi:aspartate aminotransferase